MLPSKGMDPTGASRPRLLLQPLNEAGFGAGVPRFEPDRWLRTMALGGLAVASRPLFPCRREEDFG
jgi:hypothetical protein